MKYLILGLIPLLTFCKNAEQTTSESAPIETTGVVKNYVSEAGDAIVTDPKKGFEIVNLGTRIQSDFAIQPELDRVTITKAFIEGDSLKLSVQFGGGCRQHEFSLVSDGKYMKSMPPRLNMYLEHKHNDDACRAFIHEDLAFDLSAIRYAAGNKLVLQVVGWDSNLVYEYQ